MLSKKKKKKSLGIRMAMDLSIAMLKTTERCLHISEESCFQSEVLYTDNHMKFLDSKEAPGDSH